MPYGDEALLMFPLGQLEKVTSCGVAEIGIAVAATSIKKYVLVIGR